MPDTYATNDGYCADVTVYESDDDPPEPSLVLDKHGQPMIWYHTQRNRIGFMMPWWREDE